MINRQQNLGLDLALRIVNHVDKFHPNFSHY